MAGLSDIQRKAAAAFDPVIHYGETVILTDHGKTVAEIRPKRDPVEVSIEEFRSLELSDEAINEAIRLDREG